MLCEITELIQTAAGSPGTGGWFGGWFRDEVAVDAIKSHRLKIRVGSQGPCGVESTNNLRHHEEHVARLRPAVTDGLTCPSVYHNRYHTTTMLRKKCTEQIQRTRQSLELKVIREIRQQKLRGHEALCTAP